MKHLKRNVLAGLAALTLAVPVFAYSGEQYAVCNLNPDGDNFLALRTCGASSCDMVTKLDPGTFVISMEPVATDHWREVIVQRNIDDWSYGGKSGWVYDKYICQVEY